MGIDGRDLVPLPVRCGGRIVMVVEQLTTLDAGFLEAEDSDRHVSLAVGGISVIEGPMPDFASLADSVAERILSVPPRFRQVVHTHLLDLEPPPEWWKTPPISISPITFTARRCPHPGGDDQSLYRFAADVMERRLDRDRPLWECWIIEGLADGRWAVLMKIHHCIADGIATMHLFAGLSDDGGEGETFATEIRAAKDSTDHRGRFAGVSLNPLDWASGLWQTAVGVTNAASLAVEGVIEITGGLLRPASPPSSLAGPPLRKMRGYSAARVSLDEVTAICHEFGVTVNDVALTAITDSFRAALVRRGEQPRQKLVADAGAGVDPLQRRARDDRQQGVDHASASPPRRERRCGRTAPRGACPIDVREGQRAAPSGQRPHLDDQFAAVPGDGVGCPGADPIAATRRRDGRHECPGTPPRAIEDLGSRSPQCAPDSAHCAPTSHRHRHSQLCGQSGVRHHRRLRRGS